MYQMTSNLNVYVRFDNDAIRLGPETLAMRQMQCLLPGPGSAADLTGLTLWRISHVFEKTNTKISQEIMALK